MLKPMENKNKFSNAKYNFDISKANKISDVLLKDK